MESTVGVVKKGLEVQEHTVKVSNKWLMYLQPVGLFRVKMAIFMNNKKGQFSLNGFLGVQELKKK